MKDLLLNLSLKACLLKDALQDERGQDLVEYALIVALIALAATAAITTVGTDISAIFARIHTALTPAS